MPSFTTVSSPKRAHLMQSAECRGVDEGGRTHCRAQRTVHRNSRRQGTPAVSAGRIVFNFVAPGGHRRTNTRGEGDQREAEVDLLGRDGRRPWVRG